MKKIILTTLLIVTLAYTTSAAPGDQPNDRDTVIWRLAAGNYTSTILGKMTAPVERIPGSTAIEFDSFAHWMQVDTAFNATYNKVFPLQVFYAFLTHFEGYTYNHVRLLPASSPPGSPSVSGTSVTCAKDTTAEARRPYLYLWNFVTFTQSAISGTLSGGTWTFAVVPSGIYVLAFDGGLPTLFLTVN